MAAPLRLGFLASHAGSSMRAVVNAIGSGDLDAEAAIVISNNADAEALSFARAKGVVGVAFTIGASGALASFAITRSSGDADLDAAARTLVQSAHFPPPPGGSAHIATSFNYVPR